VFCWDCIEKTITKWVENNWTGEENLLKEERRNRILAMLKEQGTLKSTELGGIFAVTPETIRKDLEYLDEQGLLKRTFGGAIVLSGGETPAPGEVFDPSVDLRNISHEKEKREIGKFAASLVAQGDTIVLDSSTTTLQLAKFLPEDSDIVVITNALFIINELVRKKGITVISVGGYYRPKSTSFLGSMSLKNLENFNINKAFMSGNAFSVEKGLMDPNEQEAEFKLKMIEVAQESLLLIDSSKFGRMAPITTCPAKAFSTLVSDRNLPDSEVDKLEKLQFKVYRCSND
jgi:DeoR family transcriptional regulator, aga operon transcriptional repressor